MTNELQAVEHPLVLKVRELIAPAADSQAVKQARAAAEMMKGRVVTCDEEAVLVADAAGTIADGIKALEKAKGRVLEIPRAMVAAVTDFCGGILAQLKAGKADCDTAALSWKHHVEAERERQRKEQEKVATAAARAATESGVDAMPLEIPEVGPLPPSMEPSCGTGQPMIVGGQAKQSFTKQVCIEIASLADCDPAHVELRFAAARSSWTYARDRGDAAVPRGCGKDNAVLWCGLRIWYEESVQTRKR